jgi:hypothetical protein
MASPKADEKFLGYICKLLNLKDTSIPEWGMAVVGHVREDGTQAFLYYVTAGAPQSQVVFALESIKHDAMFLKGDGIGPDVEG